MKTKMMLLGAVLIAVVLVLSSCTGKGDSFADAAQDAEDLRMEQDAAIAEFEDNRSDAVKAAEEENALLELELKKLRIKQLHDPPNGAGQGARQSIRHDPRRSAKTQGGVSNTNRQSRALHCADPE